MIENNIYNNKNSKKIENQKQSNTQLKTKSTKRNEIIKIISDVA